MRSFAASRSHHPGFQDLMPWAFLVGSGVVLTRAADFVGGFWYDPPDASAYEATERQGISGVIGKALNMLGSGWAMWSDVAVVPSAGYPPASASHFTDPALLAVEAERRRTFEAEGTHFERDHALFFSYTPPFATSTRVAEVMHRDQTERGRRQPMMAAHDEFERQMHRIEDQMGSTLRMRRMQSYTAPGVDGTEEHYDELVSYLGFSAYGNHFPRVIPREGAFLDTILGGRDYSPGDISIMQGQFVGAVSLDGFPDQSVPGICDRLSMMAMPYRFTQRFIFLDPQSAIAEMRRYRRNWNQQSVPMLRALGFKGGSANHFALAQVADVDAAISLAREARVRFGYYSAAIILRSESADTLRDMMRMTERTINECGFGARQEETHAPDVFLGSLPGNTEDNIRRPMINTANLSDTIPSSGVWTGAIHNPSPMIEPNSPALMYGAGNEGVPFRFNIHRSDNSNFAFFGPPGSGKSSLLNIVAYQFRRYRGAQVRNIDVKGSAYVAAMAAGASYSWVAGEETPSFAPFAHLETTRDRLWAAEIAGIMFALQSRNNAKPDSQQRTHIRQALDLMSKMPHRSLTNFLITVQDKEVRDTLGAYKGSMFDAAADDVPANAWELFDVTNILDAGDHILLPATIHILNRFQRGIDNAPQLWLMDEVAVQIENSHWLPRLRGLLKLMRSYNVGVGMATQNLSDMCRKPLMDIFLENVRTKVYGANLAAQLGGSDDVKGPADFYAAFGINRRQREVIQYAREKRDYYVTQDRDHRLVDFDLGPVTQALCASTSNSDVLAAKEIVARTGKGRPFALAWLEHKGVDRALLG